MSLSDGVDRGRHERFERLYVEMHPAVSAFVLRRVPELIDPSEVVADVFTVVWRRMDALPAAPEDRLWVYGIARRCVAQAVRSSARRRRLDGRA